MIVHGQMFDTLILVTFLVLPITFGKKKKTTPHNPKPWQFATFTKIPLKMTQNINRASHLPHFPLKE